MENMITVNSKVITYDGISEAVKYAAAALLRDIENTCAESDEPTAGKVSVSGYQVFDSDDTHQGKNGYQWQILTVKLAIGDLASNQYGFRYNYVISDCFSIESFTRSYRYDEEKGYNVFTVNWYGEDYDECRIRVICNNGEWRN